MPVSSCTEWSGAAGKTLLGMVDYVLQNAMKADGLQLPPTPENELLLQPAACFVTLKFNGELHGCIGSLYANEPLWKSVCENAYSSGFKDSRFTPLTPEELSNLSVEISILSPLELVENKGERDLLASLVPNKHGLLLEDTYHRAVFLPSVWETLTTPESFVRALKLKGGWSPDYWSQDIVVHLFTTTVIGEE